MSSAPEPADSNVLEDLVVECLGRIEADGPAALDELCRAHPEHADELRSRVELLARAGLSPRAGSERDFPERLGDFALEQRLGAGGMGVVYRATQLSLGRKVALKLIHPSELYFPGARERFRREVETVAQLQHPGVVPIYAVGEERGIPYFAMELVPGASLADLIDALKGRDPRTLDGAAIARVLAERAGVAVEPSIVWSGPWIDAALRIAREAAEALEHVHRRGIVHRDVKPSNVMLTRAGRILLVDFGLARGSADAKLTRTGSQIGSVAYMAPEQLRGEPADARADVYALGTVLWELVALRPAFQAADMTRLQRAIAAGERPKLATLHPGASDALETVLAKALAIEPGRRYATAADFARDLDHLLARRPIEARRTGTLERLRLWAARRPAEASAVALGVLLFVGAPSVIAWREIEARGALEEKQDELSTALDDAQKANTALEAKQHELARAFDEVRAERDVAEGNFRAAMEAVDRMLTRVGSEVLQRMPQMERVRRELLSDALEFCERFVAEHQSDTKLRLETALARVRVAEIHGWLSEFDESLAEFRRADDEYRALLAERPDDPELLRRALEARATTGRILRLAQQPEESERILQAAQEDLARLAGPDARERALLEARLALELGQTLGANGRPSEGREVLTRAAAALEPHAADPAEHRGRRLLVQILLRASALADDLLLRGDPDGAWMRASRRDSEAAIALADELLANDDDPQLRADRAAALNEVGISYFRQNEPQEAEKWFGRFAVECERLARDFPGIVGFTSDLAAAYSARGAMLGELGRDDEALAEARRGVEIGERLAREHPEVPDFALRLVSYRANLGWRELELGRVEEGARDVLESLADIRRAREARPEDAVLRMAASQVLGMAARAELARGEPDAAVEHLREALALGANPAQMHILAKYFVQAAAAARADEGRDAARRAELADRWLDEGVEALLSVADKGVARDQLDDPELAPLRARAGWQRLTAALDAAGSR